MIISYLATWPSRDIIVVARQQLTNQWWDRRPEDCEVYVSEPMLAEIGAGDADAATRRQDIAKDISLLEITDVAVDLAQYLSEHAELPEKAAADALHIANAACHGMDYVFTRNAAHIANAEFIPKVESLCRGRGVGPPVLYTPDELIGR